MFEQRHSPYPITCLYSCLQYMDIAVTKSVSNGRGNKLNAKLVSVLTKYKCFYINTLCMFSHRNEELVKTPVAQLPREIIIAPKHDYRKVYFFFTYNRGTGTIYADLHLHLMVCSHQTRMNTKATSITYQCCCFL